jgi:hypothetical protein
MVADKSASDLPPMSAAPPASRSSSPASEAKPLLERARAKTIARARACGVPEERLEKVADEGEKGAAWNAARAATIFFSEAAMGRLKLAQHLAFHTDLSPEAAVAVLRGAPMEEARSPGATEDHGPRKHVFYSTEEFDEAKRRGEVRPGDQVAFAARPLR